MTRNARRTLEVPQLAEWLAARARPDATLVAGLTGPVAVGKSGLARRLAAALPGAVVISTDGFLRPNAELERLGLGERKGWPESYDTASLRAFVAAARIGAARAPAYSHAAYDVVPDGGLMVDRPPVLLLEGLGFHAPVGEDVLIFLDAHDAGLRASFDARLLAAWREGRAAGGFYARFPDEAAVAALGDWAWTRINAPNNGQHVAPVASRADLVLRRDRDFRLFALRGWADAH